MRPPAPALFALWTAVVFGPAPVSASTVISHAVEGREDCGSCHGPGGVSPSPADHAGRGNETCTACHVPRARPVDVSGRPAADPCLGCHADRDLSLRLSSGERLGLHVDGARFAASIHGRAGIGCTDCHSAFASGKHPAVNARDRREYALDSYTICRKCHEKQYTGTLDSVHALVLAAGNRHAPVCTDCHTAHEVVDPDLPRHRISLACGRCHSTIVEQYRASVHGAALHAESNPDVPACTDCHGVHDIHDPRTARFRLQSPELCGKCHRNQRLMSKYGISTDVFDTYVADFHGTTIEVFQRQTPDAPSNKAVCYDCHGVHDIRRVSDPDSMVFKENMIETCRRCHPGAAPEFIGSWLGHFRPSWDRYPVVHFVEMFYKLAIPGILGGMTLLVLLDARRRLRDRRARARHGGRTDG